MNSRSTARVALSVVVAIVLGGCNDRRDAPTATPAPAPAVTAPPPAPPATPAAASTTTAEPSPADARMIAALPEGVHLYYAWDCEGGMHLVMKNLIQDRAVSLETHEGSRKLPQVVSASGARYSDGAVTFWTKGDTATYQREAGVVLDCRLVASGNGHP